MSPAQQPFSASVMVADVLGSRSLRALMLVLLAAEIYSHVVLPALIGAEKTREQKAVADYAHVTEAARADLLAEKAKVERARAAAADLFKQSEAKAATALADINRAERVVREAEAHESERLQAALAETSSVDAALSRGTSMVVTGTRRACLICFIRQ